MGGGGLGGHAHVGPGSVRRQKLPLMGPRCRHSYENEALESMGSEVKRRMKGRGLWRGGGIPVAMPTGRNQIDHFVMCGDRRA